MKNLKKVLLTGAITVAATFAMTISSNAATVKVTGEVVNIRKSASTSSSVVAMLSEGIECEYLGEEGDWYKVKYGKYTGYVSKQYTKLEGEVADNTDGSSKDDGQASNNENTSNENTDNSSKNDDTSKDETVKLTYKKFNQNTSIRLLPLIYSSEIGEAKKDDEVLILAETSGWTYVQTDEISGWTRTDTLGEAKTTSVGEDNNQDGNTTTTEKVGYVSESSVNVRRGPGTNSKIVKTLSLNAEVTITGEENGWYKVKSGSTTGYILKDYISDTKKVTSRSLTEERTSKEDEDSKKEATKTESKKEENNKQEDTKKEENKKEDKDKTTQTDKKYTEKTGYINEEYVNVRSGAGTSYKVSKVLKLNDEVTVIGEENGWYKVKSRTITGYVLKDYISDKKKETTSNKADNTTSDKKTDTSANNKDDNKTNTSTTTQTNTSSEESTKGTDIVAYAKKFLGCKYVYAGNGPTSFDCSGFTCYVFKHFGVSLPRTVSGQYYSGKGTKITKMSDLKVGDIVCFDDYSSGKPFGHCGIYTGNGNFIHASTTTYTVRISELSGTYAKRFCGALRVFK